jgi:hypothetical protein
MMKKQRPRSSTSESLEDLIAVWTPSEIENYATLVANAYRTFAVDLAAHPNVLNETELQAWNTLYAQFLKWYRGLGFFAWLTIGTVRTAEDYGKQLAYWRQLYSTKGKISPTGPGAEEIRPAADKQLDAYKTMIVAGSVAIGLVAVAVIVVKFK